LREFTPFASERRTRGIGTSNPPTMPKRRRAATVDDLGGVASNRVHFVRTDARPASAPAASRSKLKEALSSELEPQWKDAPRDLAAGIMQNLGAVSSGDARIGVVTGRRAVARALRNGALRAVLIAREAGVPLLYAHLAALAQDSCTPVCVLACGSAQLGQPFGLLRASAIGLRTESFGHEHELVRLLVGAAGDGGKAPLPWVITGRTAEQIA
jgi:ribosomal protein L7Ae-like RNA K-turn-binding protein